MRSLIAVLIFAASPLAAQGLGDSLQIYRSDRSELMRRWDDDYSPQRRARLDTMYAGWQARLHAMAFSQLNREAQVDYVLFDHELTYERWLLQQEGRRYQQMLPLIPFAPTVFRLHENRRAMMDLDPQAAADTLVHLAAAVRAAEAQLSDAHFQRPARSTGLRAIEAVRDMKNVLEDWYRFYDGYDPLFTWWDEEPYARVDTALSHYEVMLRRELIGQRPGEQEPIVGDPIGADGMRADLAHEMIPYTPQELLAIGEREYAWCLREMLAASRELGYGDDWHAALEHVKQTAVPPGEQPQLIRDLAREAEDYVMSRNLVTVPPLAREVWRMEMMTPRRQLVNPFFTGGEVISVSYPTHDMSYEDKLMSMRGNNPAFSRATVFHELIPGHHLQGFMTSRYFPYRQMFSTPFWTEGWSLYWEMRLYAMGFPRNAEDRIGMLFWRMHRAARIIFSLKFHLGQMTPEEAVNFLVDSVGHERANAEAEVRRSFNGTYPPLYQAGYMLGGLQILAMHHELVDSGQMTEAQFHDAILHGGRMPIAMVRARLENLPITRDGIAEWRFDHER